MKDSRNTYCTLFNHSYLDKGLALYNSMIRHIPRFSMYILAMDEQTEDALRALELKNVTVLKYREVVEERVGAVLSGRIGPSLFWTCTPLVIEYILKEKKEEWCTYIDADCYFFGNPEEVFDLIEKNNCSVGIVEHRFRKDDSYDAFVKLNGRFNVAFNVFRNEQESLTILKEWKEQCIQQCTDRPEDGYFGDQLYLNEWPEKYERVYIIENHGIDLAPWNVNNYCVTKLDEKYMISDESVNERIIMYHFHTLNYVTKHIVSLNLWNTKKRSENRELFELYREYLSECEKQRIIANKYIENKPNMTAIPISRKINDLISKYKQRDEKGLFQLLRNVMWI